MILLAAVRPRAKDHWYEEGFAPKPLEFGCKAQQRGAEA
jgi:hypothetical protein